MESLLMSIALKYGKGKLTDIGLNYAAKLLGIDQQTQNPKYTYGMPFTDSNISLSPMDMLKKSAFNKGVTSLISGGALAPLALGAGAIYFLEKNRKKITGYDTQQAYDDAREKRIAAKRLDKITDRIVNDKNYGNYEDAILGSDAGAVKIDDVVMHGADYFPEPPKEKTYLDPPNIHNDNNNDNSGGNFASQNTGTNESFSNKTGKGRTGYGKGGIASL
jgi:hypothetical protein